MSKGPGSQIVGFGPMSKGPAGRAGMLGGLTPLPMSKSSGWHNTRLKAAAKEAVALLHEVHGAHGEGQHQLGREGGLLPITAPMTLAALLLLRGGGGKGGGLASTRTSDTGCLEYRLI